MNDIIQYVIVPFLPIRDILNVFHIEADWSILLERDYDYSDPGYETKERYKEIKEILDKCDINLKEELGPSTKDYLRWVEFEFDEHRKKWTWNPVATVTFLNCLDSRGIISHSITSRVCDIKSAESQVKEMMPPMFRTRYYWDY